MAEQPKNSGRSAPEPAEAAPVPDAPAAATKSPAAPAPADWKSSWQVPALIGAGLVLIGGIATAVFTAPKPDIDKLLTQASQLVDRDDYAQALDYLNQKIKPYYEHNDLGVEQGRQFHILRARAVYLGEKEAGIGNEENAKTVVEEYTEAAAGGHKLEPRDQFFFADANVTLGRFESALDLANALPKEERPNRGRIVRRVVEKMLGAPVLEADDVLKLLAEFLQDRELTTADRAWALARQAQLLLRQGRAQQAIAKMVQTLPGLVSEAEPETMAELYLLLGEAYWEAGAINDASRQLEQATRLLPETDPQRGEALVLLAKIEETTRQPPDEARTEAKQKYASVISKYPGTPAVLPALLGLAEIEAATGDFDASAAAYSVLIKELATGLKHRDVRTEVVAASLLDRFSGRFDSGDIDNALKFASLAETAFSAASVPPDILLAIARSQRRLAQDKLATVKSESKILDLSHLDPATREQARLELVAAGQYFRRHAERVGVTDNDAYGSSLWMAAESFDLAGDPDQAIPLYLDYVKFFPNEPRQPEARFRLAQAYAAKGDYGMSAEYYRGLKEEGRSAANKVGPFGDASYVPLAKTLLSDGDPSNDSEAEQLLEQVVKGLVGEPTTPQFRDALVELAALRRVRGDHTGAVQLLEEAVARFPGDARINDLRYDLADSYRQDARGITASLSEGMPDQRKQALRQARVERLNSAGTWFDRVRRSLEAKDPRSLTRLEQMELRNSYFYLGDCAFDLGEYETAIHHYDTAREKYPKDPASLVAMIQIVNAYLEMGDAKRAETANNRAKAFYASLPESVWADPDLPMDKDDWQRWLDAMSRLRPADRGSATAPDAGGGGGSDH